MVCMELLRLERFGETKARTLIYLFISLVQTSTQFGSGDGRCYFLEPRRTLTNQKDNGSHTILSTLLILVHKATLSFYLRKPNH